MHLQVVHHEIHTRLDGSKLLLHLREERDVLFAHLSSSIDLVCPEGRVVGTDLGEVHIAVSHDSERTHILGGRLLRHCNEKPLVEVYGPQTTDQRGGTIALNFFAPDGRLIDERVVEHRASARERILEILPKSALVLTLLFLFLSASFYERKEQYYA